MPDLGTYSFEVLAAFGVSILALAIVIAATKSAATRSVARLKRAEDALRD